MHRPSCRVDHMFGIPVLSRCIVAGVLTVSTPAVLPASLDAQTVRGRRGEPQKEFELMAGEVRGIGGVYTGHYTCAQGYTQLTLTILVLPDNSLSGMFDFEPPGGAPRGARESAYAMKGRFVPSTGAFRLSPVRWVSAAPIGYRMVAVTGTYDEAAGTLRGTIAAHGCTTFELKRDAALTGQLSRQANQTSQQAQSLPRGAMTAGRFPEACLAVQSWTSRVSKEYPGEDMYRTVLDRVYPKLLNLFEDEYFTQFFGSPYDQLTKSERTRIFRDVLRKCFMDPQYRHAFTWEKQIERPFLLEAGSFSHAQVMAGVLERRRLRAELRELRAEIKSLPPSGAAWEKAGGYESRLEAFAVLWPSEVAGLDQAVREAKQRAAAPALELKLQQLLASARGVEGLQALRRFPSEQADLFGALDSAADADYRQRIASRADALLEELLAGERSRMEALPTGLAGLERGAAWYQQLHARFDDVSGRAAQDLVLTFLERRQQLLGTSEPELLKLVQGAKSPGEVAAVLTRYVPLPTDRKSAAVRNVQVAADARADALKRADVLGKNRPPPPPPAAGSPAAASTAAPNTGRREPSEEEMYDAVKALLDNVNANSEQTKAACESGTARQDPFLAVQCLGLFGATGGRGDMHVELTRFRKIACEKAQGRPGWVCEFHAGFSTSGLTLPPSFAAMTRRGDVGMKRFVWDGQQWLALEAAEAVRVR